MSLKKYFSWQVIVLLIILAMMIIAIRPRFSTEGVQVRSVSGIAYEAGLKSDDIIIKINNFDIKNLDDFRNVIHNLTFSQPKQITVETNTKNATYQITNSFGFKLNNLTISSVDKDIPLQVSSKLVSINNIPINNVTDFQNIEKNALKQIRFTIQTNRATIEFLSFGTPEITVKQIESSNIKKGLDLVGGTRVLLKPEIKLEDKDVESLTKVLNNRLDVYGLSDIRIRPAKDLSGNTFILAEIAGATKEEVENLLAKQGKFEAKIGNKTVFEGGQKDVTFVCRGDGSCSGIVPPCNPSGNSYACRFEFTIRLSPEAAKKHAQITKDIPANIDGYLENNLDLYLDDQF